MARSQFGKAASNFGDSLVRGNLIANFVNVVREIFVQSGMMLGIFTVMLIDILLGGVSMYFMFDGIPLIPPTALALAFSIALSTVSFSMWKMLQKGTKYDIWLVVAIVVMVPLDLWIDLAFMELVKGSGDVWMFLDPATMAAYPRPPLWWGFMFLVGLLTLVNEPLTAILTKAMQQRQEWDNKKSTSQKSPVRAKTQKYQPKHRPNHNKPKPPSVPNNFQQYMGSDGKRRPMTEQELREAFG